MYPLTLINSIIVALSASTLVAAANNANMTITLFLGKNCTILPIPADPSWDTPMALPAKNSTDSLWGYWYFQSYMLSRATSYGEELDFSGPTKGKGASGGHMVQCDTFHEKSSPDGYNHTLKADTCYNLLNGPASVSIPHDP